MEFIKKVIQKMREGYLKEMLREIIWMSHYIKKYRFSIMFYIFTGLLGTGLSLSSSILSKHVIDMVVGRQTEGIIRMAVLMTGFSLGSIAASALISRVSAKISVLIQNEMRLEMFHKILYTKWEQLHSYSTGDLLNRLNSDMGIVSSNIITWIPGVITRSAQFIGTLAVILYYDPTMAIFALISTPVTVLISRALLTRMRKYNREMREISSEIMSFQNDSFHNIQTLKAFGLMNVFCNKMKEIQEHYRGKMLEYNKFSIFVSSYMSVTSMVVSYLCFGWSVYRLWGGYITMGTLTLFLQLAGRLSSNFSSVIQFVPSLISATTSAGRLIMIEELEKESLEDPATETLKTNKGKIAIQMKNVAAAYSDQETVFKNCNFHASSGEAIAIVGPSGEGKTTLVRLLLGMISPVEGEAEIYWGEKEHCILSAATRWCFSYVPQGNTLFMGTIADNLRIVKPDATEEEMERALRCSCAWDFVRELPDCMDYELGEHGRGLSEGQAQRISIARAVLRDAPILLLDEATSALDMDTEGRVLENIMQHTPQRLCIVTTHRQGVLAMCDRIYEVNKNGLKQIKGVADRG